MLFTPGGAAFGFDVDKLLSSLSSRQITELMAFAELEGLNSPLDQDLRAGTIASAVVNSAFGRGKSAKTFVPADFFASLRQTSRRQKWQTMAANLKGLTEAMGGTVRKIGQKNDATTGKAGVKKAAHSRPEPSKYAPKSRKPKP